MAITQFSLLSLRRLNANCTINCTDFKGIYVPTLCHHINTSEIVHKHPPKKPRSKGNGEIQCHYYILYYRVYVVLCLFTFSELG